MRHLRALVLLMPLTAVCQETSTSLGVNMLYGYSNVRYLNTIDLGNAQQYDRGIDVFRMNCFFEYALSDRPKSHIIWGFGFDQSGHSSSEPMQGWNQVSYRQYYLYLPVAIKYKWTDQFYTSIGMAGGSLIESRQILVNDLGKSRGNHVFNYREFQLSSTLNAGYEIPLVKNRVLFFEAAGNYNWLGKSQMMAPKTIHNVLPGKLAWESES